MHAIRVVTSEGKVPIRLSRAILQWVSLLETGGFRTKKDLSTLQYL